ncbi:MAG: biotin/lipoyl-binding protein, partial [Terracidiphilus sp.]
VVPTKRVSRGQEELAFLPAALEIVETPPSAVGHAVGVAIIAMFSVALAWACFGHIDIVASATGKIVPSGRTKVVQPFETGVVRAIHVQDGQPVTAGEVLIELDPTINEAERNHFRGDLATVQLDIARLEAVLGDDPDPAAAFNPPQEAKVTPDVHDGTVMVADTMDGKPIGATGPMQLVTTGEKRPARWVHNLVATRVRTAE